MYALHTNLDKVNSRFCECKNKLDSMLHDDADDVLHCAQAHTKFQCQKIVHLQTPYIRSTYKFYQCKLNQQYQYASLNEFSL